jgi:DNA gyrase subunit B
VKNKYVDDEYQHLEKDVDKVRGKFRQYISFSQEAAAHALFIEILWNCLDECRNPRSPGDTIEISFDARTGTIVVTDNGRGIPLNILEPILTSLNFGSNVDSGKKAELATNILGRNGTGTLAYTSLGERTEVTSYRGGTENLFKRLTFIEGKKVNEETGECHPKKHGVTVSFKPSKILGKNTKIVWSKVQKELDNLQFLLEDRIKIHSVYIDMDGNESRKSYKIQPFENILNRGNPESSMLSERVTLRVRIDKVQEEVAGKIYPRFVNLDIAVVFTNGMTPYIDSFVNSTNTTDNGSHLDGALEALCRYFQQAAKDSLTDRDKSALDIKWDDVRSGLSIVVSINTNFEEIFVSQSKFKVSNEDLEKLIKDKTIESLQAHFKSNPNQLKDIINIVKMNAKARREADKTKNAVLRETVTNWGQYKMKNYDPCTNKGKEYKELFIVEGDCLSLLIVLIAGTNQSGFRY